MQADPPLGKPTKYTSQYDRELLCAIPRAESRNSIGIDANLPFDGCDLWTAWELTWLNPDGVPQIAVADISVPAGSPNIVESKSFKLYLNSFSMTRFELQDNVGIAIKKDLTTCTGNDIRVRLLAAGDDHSTSDLDGTCIDSAATACDTFEVDAGLLSTGDEVVSESLYSNGLRSLCPVTGQPDIGSVLITYDGPRIDPAGLLRYIVSYRQHNDFHEACVEKMFVDIMGHCQPERLTVYARYQRRGGIDINPFRSNFEAAPPNARLWRQ